ncbi:MAG: AAA family ATPase [Coprobacillus sp.]|nr:AAA family ATPase [Coprobacillus sp.]
MKRKIEARLLRWKENSNRLPLVIFGARQVGKTYTLKAFGEEHYKNTIYLDFETFPRYKEIFEDDISPSEIINRMKQITGEEINKNTTLIILDEIQNCPRALTSLKYFSEVENGYHIVAAGSLLGNAVNKGHYSFPVGKVDILYMRPLDFEEFLMANNRNDLVEAIRKSYRANEKMFSLTHDLIFNYYDEYLEVGGMPEAVNKFINTGDMNQVHEIHSKIILSYRRDMKEYASNSESIKIGQVYDSISSQLARENKKFMYGAVKPKAQAKTFFTPIHWLVEAGVVYRLNRVKEVVYPIKPYEDIGGFKLYYNDTGLYLTSINLILSKTRWEMIPSEIRGGIIETYAMSQLIDNDFEPFYWESHGIAEIDFIIQKEETLIPIEIKSSRNSDSKALKVYKDIYTPKVMIKASKKNFGMENDIKSIPLYALFCLGDRENK